MKDKYKTEPCPTCGSYTNRAVTVDAVVFNNRGELLLIKRGVEPFKGSWGLPGGHIEWDEDAEQAALRELREEIGLVGKNAKMIGVYSDPGRSPTQTVNISYVVEVKGKIKAGDDAVDIGYFDLKNLPELPFDHDRIVEDALKMRLGERKPY